MQHDGAQLDFALWLDGELPPAPPALRPVPAADGAWGGAVPRAWQLDALPKVLAAVDDGTRGVVSAVMGSGKSVLIAEAVSARMPSSGACTVVTTPTVRLVDQLAATLADRVGADRVGKYYTHAKQHDRDVVVCCQPSAVALAEEMRAAGRAVHLWVADEAHKTQATSMLAAATAFAARAAVGFTATPFRALRTEDLSLWTSLLYEYTAADAIRDGVVVPPRLVQWLGGDAKLDDVCESLIAQTRRFGPGLCNAADVADADTFALRLSAGGCPSRSLHSKQSQDTQTATLADLQAGRLACVVHVNMLAEGVDLPWLRWLCMRRPVRSRVRFCQEVGRVLRASPGKECAWLIDPHDLFDSFGLTYEAVLAGQAVESQPPDVEAAERALAMRGDPATRMVQGVEACRRYVRMLYLSMLSAGVVEQRVSGTSWRSLEPSDKQRTAVRWACAGLARDAAVPMVHRKALAEVADAVQSLRRGDVSDLLSVGFALKDRRRDRLPWPLTDDRADNLQRDAEDADREADCLVTRVTAKEQADGR